MSDNRDLMVEANLISRLERTPLNKALYLAIAMLAWCYVLEAFDLGLIGQVVAVLKRYWELPPSAVGTLGSCSTFGVIIGTACAGMLADKYGRKRVLLWGTFIFTFFTLIGAIFGNFTWVVVTRFIAGLGAGAVFPQPYLMISEFSPSKYRGRLACTTNAILGIAYILPAVVGAWAIEHFPLSAAWRVPFIIGGLPVLTLFFINKYLPESPRWLMMRGRYDAVRKIVENFENSAGVAHDDNYINPAILASLEQVQKNNASGHKAKWIDIFKPPYLSRTLTSWGLFAVTLITWYVVMVYSPTILANHGIKLSSAVAMAAIFNVGIAIGHMLIGPAADKFGRRPATTVFISIAVISFAVLPSIHSEWLLFVAGWFGAMFGVGTNAIFRVYIAEQFPTELRGFGTGMGEAVCRFIGGVLATYYIAYLVAMGGLDTVFYFLSIAYVVSIIAMWIWGRETAGINVESTSTGSSEKLDSK